MLVVALVLAGLLLVAANWSVRTSTGYAGVLGIAILFFFGSPFLLAFFSLPLALSCVLLGLLSMICAARRVSPVGFATWSIGLVSASFVFTSILAIPELNRIVEIQKQYPFESIRERLSYEQDHPSLTKHPVLANKAGDARPAPEAATAQDRLDQIERSVQDRELRSWRSHSLMHFHRSMAKHFANSQGFGVSRMRRPRQASLALDQPSPAPLPVIPDPDSTPVPGLSQIETADVMDDGEIATRPVDAANAAEQLWGMHVASMTDFVNAEGFGYVRSLDEVAGFQSHQFREFPELPDEITNSPASSWTLRRLELVSLLKHDEPRAYVTGNLPRMEDMADAPTRRLDGFEQRALRELESGKDLIVDDDPHRIRLFGSLRATRQCVECHDAQRGHLLGAFTYEFQLPGTRNKPDEPREAI